MHYTAVLSFALAGLHFSSTALGLSIPNFNSVPARAEDHANIIPFPFDEDQSAPLEQAFDAITSIPDSVLDEGDDALTAWLTTHGAAPKLSARGPLIEQRQSIFQMAQCAAAILKAVAENALPVSKLRRIKELIKLLGGASKVAKLLLKARTFKQIIAIGGPELQEIAEILLGLTDVVNDCFSF